tara:strand:+ start:1255 stop:1983 length:729 start_codon:yes stop_codon:yes gene_type:complete
MFHYHLQERQYTDDERAAFVRLHSPFGMLATITFDRGSPHYGLCADMALQCLDSWAYQNNCHMRHFLWASHQPEMMKAEGKRRWHFHSLVTAQKAMDAVEQDALLRKIWAVDGVCLTTDGGYTWVSSRVAKRAKEGNKVFQKKLIHSVDVKPIDGSMDSMMRLVNYLDKKHHRMLITNKPYYFGCPHNENRCNRKGRRFNQYNQSYDKVCCMNNDIKVSSSTFYNRWLREAQAVQPQLITSV